VSTQTSPIQLENITHSYDDKTVLSGVSHAFDKYHITALLGKSGSGKTTLLQIVNGMIKPDGGQVKLFSESIQYDNIHALRLKLGYVVQQVGLFPHLTIQSNITLLGKITKMNSEEMNRRVGQLIEMVKLDAGCLSQYPHQLSGGEQQRVGLCRAMFLNPPVLLMDEPFASLDYETKRAIHKHLLMIQQTEPRTIILITHDWEEALTLADRFIWMKDGAIKEQGDKSALEKLKSTYLAD